MGAGVEDKATATPGTILHLLTLPYDIRYTVYSHFFPSLQQIYLMADHDGLSSMMTPDSIGTNLSLTCRQLQAEAGDYIFNNYLFNVIGYKKHCMAHYRPVYSLMERYAKHGASNQILDNGSLSSTACVSIYAKDGHVEGMLRARQRGVLRDYEDVEEEIAMVPEAYNGPRGHIRQPMVAQLCDTIAFLAARLDVLTTPMALTTILFTGLACLIAMAYRLSGD